MMNLERAILISFLGSYLVNTVASALVYMIPGALTATQTGFSNPYYLLFLAVSVIVIGILTGWYLKTAPRRDVWAGAVFGIIGIVVVIVTTLISGISNAWFQTGSYDSISTVLSSFVPLFTSVQTAVLVLEWIIPAGLVGWWMSRAPRM